MRADGLVLCLQHQGRLVMIGPLSHRTVVVVDLVVTKEGENECSVRRTDSSLS
jgi:hypothetical protein